MSEVYILDPLDNVLTILSEGTGLESVFVTNELNRVAETPLRLIVDATEDRAKYVQEENQVVIKDKDGELLLFVIKEVKDIDDGEFAETIAVCEPAFMELKDKMVVERRFDNQQAQRALTAALEGTRWTGTVETDLGTATTNFYYLSAIESVWRILEVWGGEIKDVVEFDGNRITARKIRILARRGVDKGKRFDIEHNVAEIQRTVMSYPVTAIYGRGASLPIEDGEGDHTGGYTRYIDFADVEWRKSAGDPVDKPKGQRWVGDPEALKKYGREHEGKLLHREAEWQNGDYDEPEEVLKATWDQLQKINKPEVHYKLSAHLFETLIGYEHERASLGDTARAIDRNFSRPIEIQTRIIKESYDLLDIDGTAEIELGQFLSAHDYDDRLDNVVREINDNRGRWEQGSKPIGRDSYQDIEPSVPANVEAVGGYQTIQVYWSFNLNEVYVQAYELFASQVKGFLPSQETMIYRGPLNGFNYQGETNTTYYFRVRAVNYHGRPSNYSAEVSASTVRVVTDDILFGPELAERLRELNKEADIIGKDGINFDQIQQDALDRIQERAKVYSDQEIAHAYNELSDELKVVNENVEANRKELAEKEKQLKEDIGRIGEGLTDIEEHFTEQFEMIDGRFSGLISKGEVENLLGDKVDQTVYDKRMLEIGASVEGIEFDLKQTSGTVDNLTGDVGDLREITADLKFTSEGFSTSIQEIEKSIDEKVDGEVYRERQASLDLTLEGITGSVSDITSDLTSVTERQAEFSNTLNGFSTSVTELITQEIGGQNITRSTEQNLPTNGWQGSTNTITKDVRVDEWNTNEAVRVVSSGGTAVLKSHITLLLNSEKIPGDYYTISAWVKNNHNLPCRITNNNSGSVIVEPGFSGRIHMTFRTNQNSHIQFSLNAMSVSENIDMTIWRVQLEEGNKMTGYKPPTKDFVDQVSYTKRETELNATLEGITGRVSTTEGSLGSITSRVGTLELTDQKFTTRIETLEKFQSDTVDRISKAETEIQQTSQAITFLATQKEVDSLSGRMSTSEGRIDVMSDRIDLRVEKDGIISAINLSPEQVKIDTRLLQVGDFTNLVDNGDFEDDVIGQRPKGWIVAGSTIFTNDMRSWSNDGGSNQSMAVNPRATGNVDIYQERFIKASAGDQIHIEAIVRTLNNNGTNAQRRAVLGFRSFDGKKNPLSHNSAVRQDGITSNFALISGTVTAPANTEYIRIWVSWNNSSGINNTMYFDNIVARRRLNSQLIVDGSITANHMTANSITAGNAAIANAAITRANLQQAIITNAYIQDGTIQNAKIASVSADKLTAGTIQSVDLESVRINGSTITSIAGTNDTRITGGTISATGQFSRTWRGTTTRHNTSMRLENGYFRARNNTEDRSLYFSDFGIATYADGSGEGSSSGVIEFFSRRFGDINGLTLYSSGHVGVDSMHFEVISQYSISLMSDESTIYFRPNRMNRPGNNAFAMSVANMSSASETDGFYMYGSTATGFASGLRFSKAASNPYVAVVDGNFERGGNTTLDAGTVRTNNIFKRTSNTTVYWNGTSSGSTSINAGGGDGLRASGIRANSGSSDIFLATNSGGAVRVTNELGYNQGGDIIYRRIAADDFVPVSSEKYKENIEVWHGSALDAINSSVLYTYNKKGDAPDNRELRYGLIIERETPQEVVTIDREGIAQYSMISFAWKAIQELNTNMQDNKDEVSFLVLENQLLKRKIKELEEQIA